jgi:hypothetical protein
MEYTIIGAPKSKTLQSLHLERDADLPAVHHLTVTLFDEQSGNSVTIRFENVIQLEVTSLNPGILLGPLKARDLKEHQLEGIRYQVRDYENQALAFQCAKIVIQQ